MSGDSMTANHLEHKIGHASLLDQAHSLKLELAGKLPSLHDPPPAPSKHLTRCLRNRVQANIGIAHITKYLIDMEMPREVIDRMIIIRPNERFYLREDIDGLI